MPEDISQFADYESNQLEKVQKWVLTMLIQAVPNSFLYLYSKERDRCDVEYFKNRLQTYAFSILINWKIKYQSFKNYQIISLM